MLGEARKLRVLVAAFVLLAVAALACFTPAGRPVEAQVLRGSRLRLTSAGPVQMTGEERALIGLLLPAVQRAREPFRLALVQSDGKTLVEVPLETQGGDSPRTAFYDVFFADGSVRVLEHATGRAVFTGRLQDGLIIVVCLPAVQRDGQQARPITGSVQLFRGSDREQILGMCDGSV